jgi:hypothetical protein
LALLNEINRLLSLLGFSHDKLLCLCSADPGFRSWLFRTVAQCRIQISLGICSLYFHRLLGQVIIRANEVDKAPSIQHKKYAVRGGIDDWIDRLGADPRSGIYIEIR